uniref:SH3 domain-containing protein n=1 Tax=Altererythrobacter segetis TaxID=1104773 RepID=UPI0014082EEF|nr:SH3 domain-containing protein [Altererythrobacter segetis]
MLRRLAAALLFVASFPAQAQDREVPYWASMRADEVNMRVGPSESYPVEWVYHRANLPVKVVRLYQGWRRVRDQDGAEGWIVARLLSPERSAVVVGKGLAAMRAEGNAGAALRWNLEPGVVGKLGDCDAGWCELSVGPRKGWVEQKRLWGAGDP